MPCVFLTCSRHYLDMKNRYLLSNMFISKGTSHMWTIIKAPEEFIFRMWIPSQHDLCSSFSLHSILCWDEHKILRIDTQLSHISFFFLYFFLGQYTMCKVFLKLNYNLLLISHLHQLVSVRTKGNRDL